MTDIQDGTSTEQEPETELCDRCGRRRLKSNRDKRLLFLIDEKGNITQLTAQEPETAEIEIEGGGSNWWYVCSECHGTIDMCDQFCRHCGKRIKRRKKEPD